MTATVATSAESFDFLLCDVESAMIAASYLAEDLGDYFTHDATSDQRDKILGCDLSCHCGVEHQNSNDRKFNR
jgi:hypothetical protein